MNRNTNEWKCLYDEKGVLVYEGFTKNNKPCGEGTSYFSNGNIYQEGLFGVKGFHRGREYYPDGTLRFEGVYSLNTGYGPNYPRYGFFQTRDSSYTFEGKFRVSRSGLGYPKVTEPENYVIFQPNRPDVPLLMWADVRFEKDPDHPEPNSSQEGKIYTFEEYRDMVEKSYLSCFSEKQQATARKFFATEEAQREVRSRYKKDIEKLKNIEITDTVFQNGCADSTAYCLYLMME